MNIKRVFLTWFARICSIVPKRRSGYLVCSAPVPERNRGDQAMLEVVTNHLLDSSNETVRVLTTSMHPVLTLQKHPRLIVDTLLAPAFFTNHSFREQLKFLSVAHQYRGMLVIGADVLDEGYSVERSEASLYMLKLASSMGLSTRILGFSVNGIPSDGLAKRLNQLQGKTTLCVRDPVSFSRLGAARIPGCIPVGDLAYLLSPRELSDEYSNAKEFISKNQGKLIGLNLTQDVIKLLGQEESVLNRFASAFRRIIRELDLKVLLIPHDEPEGVAYLTKFRDRLDLSPDLVSLIAPLPHSGELKWIAGQLQQLFTCRLHLGIAALGMGVPVTGFPYQGKFEGQFDMFGLDRSGLITSDRFPADDESLFLLLADRIRQSQALAHQIRDRFTTVKKACLLNFENL